MKSAASYIITEKENPVLDDNKLNNILTSVKDYDFQYIDKETNSLQVMFYIDDKTGIELSIGYENEFYVTDFKINPYKETKTTEYTLTTKQKQKALKVLGKY